MSIEIHASSLKEGPMLVTHCRLSGPVVLRLSAWGARDLFGSEYRGVLLVDFVLDDCMDDVKRALIMHKDQFGKQKLAASFPSHFCLVKRFWKYLLDREVIELIKLRCVLGFCVSMLKKCSFEVTGKGQFKDEFITAGGVPLSEVTFNTMESRIAGEILNVME